MLQGTVSEILERGAAELRIKLPSGAGITFEKYYKFLEDKSRNFNLTAISGAEETARLHFLDSLALLDAADFKSSRVIDIGSGAGFPGLPLKIAEPTIALSMLDATAKRVEFLNDLCAELGVEAVCIHSRAEEIAHRSDMREKYDFALSRAVARLNMLCELCLPFVNIGGLFLAMKSVNCEDEIDESFDAARLLGAEFIGTIDYTIPETDVKHRVVVLCKTSETPKKYPRRFAKIEREPL